MRKKFFVIESEVSYSTTIIKEASRISMHVSIYLRSSLKRLIKVFPKNVELFMEAMKNNAK